MADIVQLEPWTGPDRFATKPMKELAALAALDPMIAAADALAARLRGAYAFGRDPFIWDDLRNFCRGVAMTMGPRCPQADLFHAPLLLHARFDPEQSEVAPHSQSHALAEIRLELTRYRHELAGVVDRERLEAIVALLVGDFLCEGLP
ncbi:MAG: hypothetical protein AAF401_14440 [Pseudomonadota bacterium]